MPVLITLTFRDVHGKIKEGVGPVELYLPKVSSLENVDNEVVRKALLKKREECNWSDNEELKVEWVAFTKSIN